MEALAKFAEGFIGIFQQGGQASVSLVVGIIPLLIVLMTAVNTLIALIGPEKVEKLGEVAARPGILYYPVRYMLLPFAGRILFHESNGVHDGTLLA